MIVRLAWAGFLALVAVIVGFAQIDRAARFNPVLLPLVPAEFRGFAGAVLTRQAIAAQDGERALALATDLVRVRPMPAEHLALLSRAALLAGQAELGLAALEEAGRRGWREPSSQHAMARAALASGDTDAAVLRVAALLATGSLPAKETDPLLAQILRQPDGPEALAARMAQEGYWQAAVLRRAGSMPAGPFTQMLALAQASGAQFDCDSLAQAMRALRGAGERAGVDPAACRRK